MARYKSDKRVSEFTYYLGEDGAVLFYSRSESARKGIIKRLYNALRKIVTDEIAKNERFHNDLKQMLGGEFGKDYIFDPNHDLFDVAVVAEIMELSLNDSIPVQLFRSLIAANTMRYDGRRYVRSTPFRKGSQVKANGLQIRSLVRAKGDKPVALVSKSVLANQLGAVASKADPRDSVIHLPSGKARILKTVKRPKTR